MLPCLTGVFGVPETCVAALLGGVWALAFGVSYLDGRRLGLALGAGAAVLVVNLVLAATLIESDLPGGAGPYLLAVAALSPAGALAIVLLELRRLRALDRSARDAVTEADRLKTEVLATMSHELRTPMHAVIGLSGLVCDATSDPVQRSHLDLIASSGEHLLGSARGWTTRRPRRRGWTTQRPPGGRCVTGPGWSAWRTSPPRSAGPASRPTSSATGSRPSPRSTAPTTTSCCSTCTCRSSTASGPQDGSAELPPERRPRILALSASVLDEDREQAAAAGIGGSLPKPMTRAALAEALAYSP